MCICPWVDEPLAGNFKITFLEFIVISSHEFYFIFIRFEFRPINGQMEIIGVTNSYKSTDWKAVEGIFVHPSTDPTRKYEHTEL